MGENKQKSSIGVASIICIIVVLALTIFAILSIRAANLELKMARKSAKSVQEYYEADAKANLVLSEIDGLLVQNTASDKGVVLKEELKKIPQVREVQLEDNLSINILYEIEMNQYNKLQVRLLNNYKSGNLGETEITSWKMISSPPNEYEEDFQDYWDGNLE